MNLTDEQLKRVSANSTLLKQIQDDIEVLEAQLKLKREAARHLEESYIPELMDELGLESVTLTDGTKLTVKPFVAAHISKDHEAEAFQWLEDHGYGDIIKERTVVNVHPSTLKAWAKERVESGDNIPDDLFGVYVGRKAVLK